MNIKASLHILPLMLGLFALSTYAAVSPGEAAKLGATLTLMGAERAGNTDGSIPAWTGGLPKDAGAIDAKGFLADPFADEQPLFVITAQNVEQYKDRLTPGQLALFKRYPDSYRMPVYKTHRSANLPANWLAATRDNATRVTLAAGGNGLENYRLGIPFPIPQDGLEVIWNHLTHYAVGARRSFIQVTPQQNGAYSPVQFQDEILPFHEMRESGNLLFFLKQRVIAPARLAGNVLLIHETLNQVKEPRQAWQYNAGQRRVRRAPQVAYDGPGTAADGMRTADNFDMFNGAPDRYDWQLHGKKELYIPYNSYRLDSPGLKYDEIIQAGHINQDLARYELHRVWHVTATLKPGARHIYAKRDFYIDEDSWLIATVDHYDGRGALWRVAEGHPQYYYHQQLPWFTFEALYDLLSGRYLALGLKNEERQAWEFDFKPAEASFTPTALRQAGVR
jgi:hypothetical protein